VFPNNNSGFMHRNGAVIAMVLLFLITAALFLPPGAVWITDNGNKYIIARNFLEHGTTAIRHPAPEFFPYGGFHFIRIGDSMRSFYPEYLPLLTAPFIKIAGPRGVLFWPFAGTLALLWCFSLSVKRRGPLFIPMLFAATPVVFYSLVLWETTPAMFFALAGTGLLMKKKSLAAGLTMAAGLIFREELYFVAGASAAALLLHKEWRQFFRFAAGAALITLPLWAFQYFEYGHILGLHGAYYHLNNRPSPSEQEAGEVCGILWNYYHHLLRFDVSWSRFHDLLLIPFAAAAAAGCAGKFRSLLKLKYLIIIFVFISFAILYTMLFRQNQLSYAAAQSVGLLPATPLILGFLLNWRPLLLHTPGRHWRTLTLALLIYLIAVPPVLTRHDIGLVWGARHFFYIMPPMIILSFIGWRGMKLGMRSFLLTALAGLTLQIFGLYALAQVSEEGEELTVLVENLPQKTIVTDVFFLPEQTPRLFFSKEILELSNHNSSDLISFLQQHPGREFILILSPGYRRISNDNLAKLLAAAPLAGEPLIFKRQPGSGFMELFIAICRVPSREPAK